MNQPHPKVPLQPAVRTALASVGARIAAVARALLASWQRMPRSWLAALVVGFVGLFSMGLLGGLLYFVVAPVVWPLFGNLNDWSGDDVWPATIGAGMFWSLCFLLAGWLNQRWLARGWSRWRRRLAYAGALWVGAALLWLFMASTMDIRFDAGPSASVVPHRAHAFATLLLHS